MSEQQLLRFEERGVITIGHIDAASVLDALNVTQFGKEVLEYATAHPGLNLLLDFQRVQYLSSTVLTELLRIHQVCKDSGGGLRLCGLNKDIQRVFEITNLDKMFTMYGALDDAILRYARSLTIEAEEQAWSHLTKDV
ncbi:MAG: STAS domain-containing protein [Candidatus Hydrogenedentes bacterium]|nr:STAS domain-containing protein [Candidatus Hydrogenedentota bacterium]